MDINRKIKFYSLFYLIPISDGIVSILSLFGEINIFKQSQTEIFLSIFESILFGVAFVSIWKRFKWTWNYVIMLIPLSIILDLLDVFLKPKSISLGFSLIILIIPLLLLRFFYSQDVLEVFRNKNQFLLKSKWIMDLCIISILFGISYNLSNTLAGFIVIAVYLALIKKYKIRNKT